MGSLLNHDGSLFLLSVLNDAVLVAALFPATQVTGIGDGQAVGVPLRTLARR